LDENDQSDLEQLVADGVAKPAVFVQIRRLFHKAGAFEKALRLVQAHRSEAQELADGLAPEALRRLAHYLIETVLEMPAATSSIRRPLAVPAR
jgi:hypothetical protein